MKIQVGKVLKAQGIKGEVKISCLLDNPKMLLEAKQLYLCKMSHAVQAIRTDGSFCYVRFVDVTDRNAAEALKGEDVFCDKDSITLPEARFFVEDVLGCNVVLDDGTEVGKVSEVLQYGAADVYVCKRAGKNGDVSFPLLKDLVAKFDVNAGSIVLLARRFSEVAVYNED